MKEMLIYTNEYRGTVYRVDLETGNITYGSLKPSGQWKFKGFSHIKKNDFISLDWIRKHPEVVESNEFWFKNGLSQYRVRDLDYGTTREWGSRVTGVTIE